MLFPANVFDATGVLRIRTTPPDASVVYNGGVAMGPDFVYATATGPLDAYHNGLPFAAGRLIVQAGGPASWQNGLPFTPTGGNRLCYAVGGSPEHFHQGMPFTLAGNIPTTAV